MSVFAVVPFAFLSLAALVIGVGLAGVILLRNPRGRTARIYVLLLATFIIWALPEFLIRLSPPGDPDVLRLLIRVQWTGIAFIPGVMTHFVLEYPRRSPLLERPWALLLIYTPSIIFTSFLWAGDLLVRDVVQGPMGPTALVGDLYLPLASLYALIIILALYTLGRAYVQPQDQRSKRRSALLLAGFAIPTLAGTVTEVFWPVVTGTGTRLGLGTAYTTVFLAFVALAIFRYGFLAIAPVREVASVERRFGWAKGRNYIVLEPGRENSFAAFRELVEDAPGLCVTGFPPPLVAQAYGLERTPVLWLSTQEGYAQSLRPTYLEVDVLQTLLKFLRENAGSVLLLDDVEYLVEVNGFKPVVRTVATVASAASKSRGTLIVNVHPEGLPSRQMTTLRGLFDEVPQTEAGEHPTAGLLTSPSVLWKGDRAECLMEISRATLPRKIVISTLFPEKLQTEYDLYDAVYLWITPTPHPNFSSYDASRLDLEVIRDASRSLTADALLYLGELELLVEATSFLTVLEYVKYLVDLASARSSLVVASVSADAIAPGQLSTLEKRFAAVVG